MEHRTVKKSKLNFQSFRHRRAVEEDCEELVDHDIVITLEGEKEPALVYVTNTDSGSLYRACQ